MSNLKSDIPLEIPDDLARVLRVMTQFGIVNAFDRLDIPAVEPKACMTEAQTSLDLLAFHGNKWLGEEWLAPQLDRLHRRKTARVRFLLSEDLPAISRPILGSLHARYPKTFEARTFQRDRAYFRLVFINEHRMLFTHYGAEVIEERKDNVKGWGSPQLVVDMSREWSLAIPFRQYFERAWNEAERLTTIDAAAEPAAEVRRRGFRDSG